jgi:hypothetical protein
MKILSGCGKDNDDAEGIAARQELDADYITRRLEPLLEAQGTPEIDERGFAYTEGGSMTDTSRITGEGQIFYCYYCPGHVTINRTISCPLITQDQWAGGFLIRVCT